MKTYRITFKGVLKGALGIPTKCSEKVKAENAEAAKLSLYDKYDHVYNPQFKLL